MTHITDQTSANRLRASKRLVLKIGSALLVDAESGAIRRDWLAALADDIAQCRARGQEVVIVSSGAISLGRRHLGLAQTGNGRGLRLEESQAAAATGTIRLAHAYEDCLSHHDITVALILLTLEDTENRRRHLNARNTLEQLLALGVVPVINENDTVATSEIRYGDNDRLAARVAQMVSADSLILLSDIDGLYTGDPRTDPEAVHIPEISSLTPDIEAMAGDAPPGYSSGGMVTKLGAARIALAAGCQMMIANGRDLHPLKRQLEGERSSWFLSTAEPLTARKRWIASHVKVMGRLSVDHGAARALAQGKSLLPIGITHVEGAFERGDLVLILDPQGREIGRGLSAYQAFDAQQIAGRQSQDIEQLLGYRGREVMIHRDDLVLSDTLSLHESSKDA